MAAGLMEHFVIIGQTAAGFLSQLTGNATKATGRTVV
jgi:hypothetical protein